MIRRTASEFRKDDVPGMAAGIAFKIFLALFPTILAAAAAYGLFVSTEQVEEHIATLATVLPPLAYSVVRNNLDSLVNVEPGTAGSLLVFGVAAGLFSATGAAATLIRALNRAYDITDARPFLFQRLIGLAITGALLVSLLGLILLVVAGDPIQNWLLPDRLQVPAVEIPLRFGRYVLALLVLVTLFAFAYWIGPNRVAPRWEWLSPGAVLGVLAWVAVAAGFRFYTVSIAGDSYEGGGTYGTIGGVIVLLLWLQLSMLALLTGVELNAVLDRLRTERWATRHRLLGPDGLHADEVPEHVADRQRRRKEAELEEDPVPVASPATSTPPPPPPRGSRRMMAGILASVALGSLGVAGLIRRWLRTVQGDADG